MSTDTNTKTTRTPSAADRTLPIPGTALDVRASDVEVARKVIDLDRYTDEVRSLHAMGAVNWMLAGQRLLYVEEHKLWKFRLDADGKTATHHHFRHWIRHEIGISPSTAYEMMKVAKRFTIEQVEHYGRTMLSVVASMPKETHAELLADVDAKKLTTRAVQATAKAYRQENAYVHGDGDNKPNRTQTATRARLQAKERVETAKKRSAERPDEITIAVTKKVHTCKLFARPDSLKRVDMSKQKRAKTIDVRPFGRVELTNEVVLYVFFKRDAKGLLIADITFTRSEPST